VHLRHVSTLLRRQFRLVTQLYEGHCGRWDEAIEEDGERMTVDQADGTCPVRTRGPSESQPLLRCPVFPKKTLMANHEGPCWMPRVKKINSCGTWCSSPHPWH
jgi:hypothetical protein